MFNHLKKVKDSRIEKELRHMLSVLDDPMSKNAVTLRPQWFQGYITMIYELLAEPVDRTKFFGIFDVKPNVRDARTK